MQPRLMKALVLGHLRPASATSEAVSWFFAIWGVKCEFHIFLAGKFKLLCPSFDAKLCFVVVLVIWQLSELGNCGVWESNATVHFISAAVVLTRVCVSRALLHLYYSSYCCFCSHRKSTRTTPTCSESFTNFWLTVLMLTSSAKEISRGSKKAEKVKISNCPKTFLVITITVYKIESKKSHFVWLRKISRLKYPK